MITTNEKKNTGIATAQIAIRELLANYGLSTVTLAFANAVRDRAGDWRRRGGPASYIAKRLDRYAEDLEKLALH